MIALLVLIKSFYGLTFSPALPWLLLFFISGGFSLSILESKIYDRIYRMNFGEDLSIGTSRAIAFSVFFFIETNLTFLCLAIDLLIGHFL